jgi:hypothetical protein
MDSNIKGERSLMQVGMRLAGRKQLETKMRQVFQKELKQLSQDYQSVLADDMITAFLNRMGSITGKGEMK